jgi:ankyrin repeat protein
MLACRYGHSEIASLLVESGADLNMEVVRFILISLFLIIYFERLMDGLPSYGPVPMATLRLLLF